MARHARVTVANLPLHVIHRGNNRSRVFMDAHDHAAYRKAMFIAAQRAGCAIHAYVLMSNHVHLLLTPAAGDSAARTMQRLGAIYVRRFNERHNRTGTLWEGRFRSMIIDSEHYFFACSLYIELNPLRAGMVADPGDYAWSSFRHNALGREEPGITPHRLYLGLGRTSHDRREAYRAMFADAMDDRQLEALRAGKIAGDADFKANVAALIQRRVESYTHGGDRRSRQFRASLGAPFFGPNAFAQRSAIGPSF